MTSIIKLSLVVLITWGCASQEHFQIISKPKVISVCEDKIPEEIYSMMFMNKSNEIINFLKRNNVSPNVRGVFCGTLVHEATKRNKVDLVKDLIEYGSLWDEKDEFGNTPLSKAVRLKNIQLVKLFLAKGARTNLTYSFNASLLFIALDSRSTEILDLLIEYKVCPFGRGFMADSIEKTWANDNLKQKAIHYRDNYKKLYGECEINIGSHIKDKSLISLGKSKLH